MQARVDDVPSLAQQRRMRAARRGALTLITAFVLAGLLGAWGVRTATVTTQGGPYRLQVTYPRVARPGLPIEFQIRIERPGGFPGPITVATKTSWLAMFDENGLSPAPDGESSDATRLLWRYDRPEGDVFVVRFDAIVETGMQWGRPGFVEILENHTARARADFRTRVMP